MRQKGFALPLDKIAPVFEKHEVLVAYLFGSRAKGREREESDYDIAVVFRGERATIVNEIELAKDLSDALNVPVEKVDVVALNSADPEILSAVFEEGKEIFVSNEREKRNWERRAYLALLRERDLSAVYMKRIFDSAWDF